MAVVTDTIADMLTRIRNANSMRYTEVKVPASKLKVELARILKEEGFIKDYKVLDENVQGMIYLTLKYGQKKERVITGLKRISKPGRSLVIVISFLLSPINSQTVEVVLLTSIPNTTYIIKTSKIQQ